MFERFTDSARRAIVLAQDAAREMGHAKIAPEHLLVGLQAGEGLAANAMARAGVMGTALQERVSGRYESTASAKKVNKVPFSTEGKQCLEQSLRAALALGHNYIGTEHIFLGVQRQAEGDGGSLEDLLGVSANEVARQLTEMLAGVTVGSTQSAALRAALERARTHAGKSPMTTGNVLESVLADPDSQVSRALHDLGVEVPQIKAALASVNLSETSDAAPIPKDIVITVGDKTFVISDPALAAALQHLGIDELREALAHTLADGDPGQASAQ